MFTYNATIEQIVCVQCKIAVLPSRIEKHLLIKAHQDLNREQRKTIRQEWSAKVLQLSEPSTAAGQEDGRDEIEGLSTVLGYCCMECDFRTVNEKNARSHAIDAHGRKQSECGRPRKETARERDQRIERIDHWQRHWMQCVFGPTSTYYRLFKIRRDGVQQDDAPDLRNGTPSDSASTCPQQTFESTDAMEELLSQLHEAASQEANQEDRRLITTGSEETTPWLNRVGWLEHFQGLKLTDVCEPGLLPASKDSRPNSLALKMVCRAVKEAHKRCIRTFGGADLEIRQWMKSPELLKMSMKPFNIVQKNASDRYVGYWQRFMIYCLRVLRLEGEERDMHGLALTESQQALLAQMWTQAEEMAESVNDTDNMEELITLVHCFAESVLEDTFLGIGWSNPLIHFTAVLGIDEHTGRLKDPAHYTTVLAGLVYCSRLYLYQSCIDQNWDPSKVQKSIEQFHTWRKKFFVNGTHTAMSRMLSTLAYGVSISKKTPENG